MLRSESAFGLDIGDASIKVLQISGHLTHTLKGFAEISLPAGIVVQGEIHDATALSNYITTAVKTAHISGKYAVAALPESKVFIKLLSIAHDQSLSWNLQVEAELQKHIPYELSEVWWDAIVLSETPTMRKVLVGAAPKTLVGAYTEAISAANIIPIGLDLEPLALSRAVFSPKTPQEGCILIVDLGATKSTLLMATKEGVVATADGRSAADMLTNQIAQALHIEMPEAEKMKIQNGLSEGPPTYIAIAEQYATRLAERIRTVLDHSLSQDFCPAITEVVLSGGGALLSGLPEALTKSLAVKTRLADPLITTKGNFRKILSEKEALRYTTACGLALTAASYEHF
ncbi:MAG: type IV pilus assembly protein PilM [bacterium]|nr:type IV pilus assembly protein PilM [bacterium]